MTKSVWRIMDANFNRVREGLRVSEDIFRFVKNDSTTTAKFKSIRHALNQIILSNSGSGKQLLSARESHHDVGKKSHIRDQKKVDVNSLLTANLKRVEEGLRVLEECSKIILPKSTKQFQELRFKVYVLEKSVT